MTFYNTTYQHKLLDNPLTNYMLH